MQAPEEHYLRFSKYRRLEHHTHALLVSVLLLTGTAQRFHTAAWAGSLISLLGGEDSTRLVHRYTGACLCVLIAEHILVALGGVVIKGWRASMLVTRKDFRDALVNLKYYFGLASRPARCDRYDYRQKFVYWGVLLNGLVMAATGLVLWFPVQIFDLAPFLPGQVVPAARVAHSNEAMLALLLIVIYHVYSAIFSPEVFPLDKTIFNGRISKTRLLQEHPLEYERITGQVPPETS